MKRFKGSVLERFWEQERDLSGTPGFRLTGLGTSEAAQKRLGYEPALLAIR